MAHPPDQLQYTFSTSMFFDGDFTVTHSSCMLVNMNCCIANRRLDD